MINPDLDRGLNHEIHEIHEKREIDSNDFSFSCISCISWFNPNGTTNQRYPGPAALASWAGSVPEGRIVTSTSMFTYRAATALSTSWTVTSTTRRSRGARGSTLVNWFLPTIEPIRATVPATGLPRMLTTAGSPSR